MAAFLQMDMQPLLFFILYKVTETGLFFRSKLLLSCD